MKTMKYTLYKDKLLDEDEGSGYNITEKYLIKK
jgi:hypothetical protein